MPRLVVSLSLALGMAGAAVLAAQGPAAAPPKPMTLTGCLRSTPNPDPAGAAGKPPIYTLEVPPRDTMPMPGAATTATPSSPDRPAADATSAAKPDVYTLTAGESIGLSRHVGHRVSVTGQLKDASATTPRTPATDAADRERPAPKPGGAHNTFEVTMLKMIAADCPPAP